MLRTCLTGVIILLTYMLQSIVFPSLPLLQTTPNLLLVVTFSIAIFRGHTEGGFTGLGCGLLLDIFSGGIPGYFVLIYALTGYLTGFACQRVVTDVPFIPLIFTVLSEFLYHAYIFLFSFALRGRLYLSGYMQNIVLPELVITMILSVLLYGGLLLFHNRMFLHEKRRELKFV